MSGASFSSFGSEGHKNSYIKWIIAAAIIVAALWYLNNQGYITLPFL